MLFRSKWRDVDSTPSTWTLGGGSDPAEDDGIDYDPNIIDIILEGDGQQEMLSSYDVDGHIYAQLTGFEMPELAQQIYGFKFVSSTDNSALFEWSTTRNGSGTIDCTEVNNTSNIISQLWEGNGLTHTSTMINLSPGTEYDCQVSVEDLISENIRISTSSIIDEIAPELLNLDVEIFEDGRVKITWYTSEKSTESIKLNDEIIFEYNFATKKNHEFITEPLSDGDWVVEVISADASQNSNSSELEFVISLGVIEENQQNENNANETSTNMETESSDYSSTIIQITVLIVILLIIIAFIRIRQSESDDDDIWS